MPDADVRRDRVQAVVVGLVFVGLAVAWGTASTAFQEADDVTHYSFSRWLFDHPEKIVEIWGRPVITAFYALPAQLGPTVARLASVLLGIATAGAALSIYRARGGRTPALAVACTLGMPFAFLQMYAILTELAFAAVLGAGFWCWHARRPRAAALVWSLMPLTRPEGFFLAPLLGLAFLASPDAHPSRPWSVRRFACGALLLAGTGAWWVSGLPVYRSARWMIDEWPRNWRVESVYGDGPPLLFLGFLVIVVTPIVFPFFVAGVVRYWRARQRLEVVVVMFVVALHTVLRTFGLFGSAGYPRYLVTVAPLLGAISATGIDAMLARIEAARGAAPGRRARRWAAPVVTGVMLVGILAWPHSGPVHGGADAAMLRAVWPWCERKLAENPDLRFVADHPFLFVLGDVDPERRRLPFQPHAVEYAEKGAIAVWETKFAGRYSGLRRLEDLEACGFERVPKHEVAGPGPYPWEGPRPRWGDPELENFQWEVLVKVR